jgi:predicted ATP-dependent protease
MSTFAVTGSVDQHGRIQAIGGVNEKITAKPTPR